MKFISRLIDWVRAQIAAIQAAHHEAARNLVLRLSMAFLTWKFMGDTWDAGSLTLWAPHSQPAAISSMLGGDWVGWLFIARKSPPSRPRITRPRATWCFACR